METTQISILDQIINVPNKYAAGHVLTEIEAKVLNRTFAENVGNNQRAKIKDAIAAGTVAEAIAAAEAYAATYEFSVASASGGSSKPKLSPLESECRRLAIVKVKQHIESTGRKVSEVKKADPEAYEAAVQKVAANEQIVKLAKKNLKDLEATAGIELDVAA